MPLRQYNFSLDHANESSLSVKQVGNNSGSYRSDITGLTTSVYAVDLATLPKYSPNGYKFESYFETSTSNLVSHTLQFGVSSSKTSGEYRSLFDSEEVRLSNDFFLNNQENITNIELRKGSLFADSINQNVSQKIDVTAPIAAALEAKQRFVYFYWNSKAGIDNVKNFEILGSLSQDRYTLKFKDDATRFLNAGAETINLFGSVRNGAATIDGDEVIDINPSQGGGPTASTVRATPFNTTTSIVDDSVNIRITQSRSEFGSLSGDIKSVQKQGGATIYNISGTIDTIFDKINALKFNISPPKQFGVKTVSFRSVDADSGEYIEIYKEVKIETNNIYIASFDGAPQAINFSEVRLGQTLTMGLLGSSFQTFVTSGGQEIVGSGGTSFMTALAGPSSVGDQRPEAKQTVLFGGEASKTGILQGGLQSVYGVARGTSIGKNGIQAVESG